MKTIKTQKALRKFIDNTIHLFGEECQYDIWRSEAPDWGIAVWKQYDWDNYDKSEIDTYAPTIPDLYYAYYYGLMDKLGVKSESLMDRIIDNNGLLNLL